jgi:hypothetical protein
MPTDRALVITENMYPTIIGRGRRLFESDAARAELELADSKRFRSGIVLLTYRAV